jgi:hypothetical protein
MNLGHFLAALITFANPEKNCFPCASFSIAINSSNDAPEQKILSPPDFKTTTKTSLLLPVSVMVSVSFCRISSGNELLWGWKNSMVPIPSLISNFT